MLDAELIQAEQAQKRSTYAPAGTLALQTWQSMPGALYRREVLRSPLLAHKPGCVLEALNKAFLWGSFCPEELQPPVGPLANELALKLLKGSLCNLCQQKSASAVVASRAEPGRLT